MNTSTTAKKEQLDVVMSFAQKGDYQQALLKGNLLMRQFPLDPILPNLVGTLYQTSGKGEAAIISFKQAIKLKPDFYQAYYNMAISLKDSDKHQDAIDANKKAIKLNPNYFEAHANMGVSLHALERFDEAVISYKKSISINPRFSHVHENLANVLKDMGRFDDAIKSYIIAVKIRPDNEITHFNMATCLEKSGNIDAAIGAYLKGFRINPNNAIEYCNLGNLYLRNEKPTEAMASFEKAIKIDPDYAEAHMFIGNIFSKFKQDDDAKLSLEKSIELDGNNAHAHFSLATLYARLDLLNDAVSSFEKAIKIKPDFADANMLLADAFIQMRQYDKAMIFYERGIKLQPDCLEHFMGPFFNFSIMKDLKPDCLENFSGPFFDVSLDKGTKSTHGSKVSLFEEELFRIYNEQIASTRKFTFNEYKSQSPSRKIRIGFVSGDLAQHPVAFFLKKLLQHMDKDNFDSCVFCNLEYDNKYMDLVKSYASEWYSIVDIEDADAAKLIHEKSIDILLDLSGHTGRNRLPLFTYRPAPIQAAWLGYWDTTGLKEMDYIIGDPYLLPKEIHHKYSEEVVLLDSCWMCFDPPTFDVPVAPTPALKNKYVTFGCFQKHQKVTSHTIRVWSKILNEVPGSKMLFKFPTKLKNSKDNIISNFSENSIDANRLIFLEPSSLEKYYDDYKFIDIALDTFPYPGLTVSCDTLWMGVPVVTKKGDSLLSNLGYTVAINSDQAEFSGQDDSEYIDIAIKLAQDINKLNKDRLDRRQRIIQSNLCDGPSFAKSFEKLMKKIIFKERND